MRRLLVIISLLAALLLVPASASAADPLFGLHTPGDPYWGSTHRIDDVQRTMGRPVAIVSWFQSWATDNWSSRVQRRQFRAVLRSHRQPLLTWEPWRSGDGPWQPQFSLARIAYGAFDGYIARWARGMRALRSRVYLRPMHEMNGNWYPWGGTVNNNSPELFKAAWQRMVTIFRQQGANNVRFVWCPINEDFPKMPGNSLERYYPGRNYVDVLGMDGYNWGASRPEFGGWRSFDKTFSGAYKRLRRLGRQPIWIPEVGSSAIGGSKTSWIRAMFSRARGMKQLRAIVWMDTVADGQDWSVNYPAGTARAFRTGR